MTQTQNPELQPLADRLADAERQIDALREMARRLLHEATDARVALDAVTGELRDLDARPDLLGGMSSEDQRLFTNLIDGWQNWRERQRNQAEREGGVQ